MDEILKISNLDEIGRKYISSRKPWEELKLSAVKFMQYLLYTTVSYQIDTEDLKKAVEFEVKDEPEQVQYETMEFFYEIINTGKKD